MAAFHLQSDILNATCPLASLADAGTGERNANANDGIAILLKPRRETFECKTGTQTQSDAFTEEINMTGVDTRC